MKRAVYLTEEEETEEKGLFGDFSFNFGGDHFAKTRLTGVYGHVCEERAAEVVYTLWTLKDSGVQQLFDEDGEVIEEKSDPIDFLVSTYGGSTDEMFSIYDTMRMVKEDCEIHTYGRGKVKSAGVLLLAAGTKGHRKIGEYCNVMIHDIAAGMEGKFHDLKLEQKHLESLRDNYIKALTAETKLTRRKLLAMFKKGNIYISAKDAIKYGIADEIG